ncbi:hypothetical protein LTR37_011472 [Vermiconidia calcicola]|uniref:Uncharacterized protein n=1 Tax=Vermiconidia calcicola TaxID=1690605 RepID=A0ACC3N277_9PEZI|nr:hypothetical protein LTR37_011472 [Vermiconidia calcicola]
MPSSEPKIKSKDLSYENNLPPFLQRLHAQKAGLGDQDRHERQIARPKRAKADDEDDGPTVVDESGELVSKEQMEEKLEPAGDDGADTHVNGTLEGDGEPRASGAIQTHGTAMKKKRKLGKVVGEDENREEPKDAVETGAVDDSGATKKSVKKAKKNKPIKLAFDDNDET